MKTLQLSYIFIHDRHRVVSLLAPYNMNRFCSEGGILIQIFLCKIRKWFEMGIFRLFRRMHCIPIVAFLAITRLAKVSWYATGIEWLAFDYDRSRCVFIPTVSEVTHTRADGMEVIKSGHHEVSPNYGKEFVDSVLSRLFAVRVYFFLRVTSIQSIQSCRCKFE